MLVRIVSCRFVYSGDQFRNAFEEDFRVAYDEVVQGRNVVVEDGA